MRRQAVIRFEMPEDTLPDNHRARLLWRLVQTLDLSAFTARARAVEGRQGRDLLSVHMLLTLWLYAISVGIGSAREIARRIRSDDAFRWIVGDQSVGHVTLSTFRVGHREALDKLMTDVLAGLLHKGLLSLDLVAQDGTRVRASASAPSFRREASLLECREQAALHVKAVFAEADDPTVSETEKRAREAAALEYQRRVEAAIDTVRELQAEGKLAPRASTTDADARNMKMPDGGFRPAYNIRMATAGSAMGGPRTIIGVQVTNIGSDMGALTPMLDEIQRRTGTLPAVLLADANHAKHECIRNATERGVEVLIPVPERAKKPDAQQDPAIAAWHDRMATDEAKQKYRARPSRTPPRCSADGRPASPIGSSLPAPRHQHSGARGANVAAHRPPTTCPLNRRRERDRLRGPRRSVHVTGHVRGEGRRLTAGAFSNTSSEAVRD